VSAYEVVYIFQVGRWDIDRVRVYMPFDEAQTYFNRDGVADEIEVMLDDPEDVGGMVLPILTAAGGAVSLWTWQDSSGAFLQALQMEDNIMFVILSILVLIATMNIVSGLIMLVKNKSRDIGILRTMGLSEGRSCASSSSAARPSGWRAPWRAWRWAAPSRSGSTRSSIS
jgi:lipoprotein-releasing system permease protein